MIARNFIFRNKMFFNLEQDCASESCKIIIKTIVSFPHLNFIIKINSLQSGKRVFCILYRNKYHFVPRNTMIRFSWSMIKKLRNKDNFITGFLLEGRKIVRSFQISFVLNFCWLPVIWKILCNNICLCDCRKCIARSDCVTDQIKITGIGSYKRQQKKTNWTDWIWLLYSFFKQLNKSFVAQLKLIKDFNWFITIFFIILIQHSNTL